MSRLTRIYYNKLVRDNTQDKIEAKGIECDVRAISDPQEFQQELFKKVREEADSVSMARTKEDFLNEYADLMVALNSLIEHLDISKEELQAVYSDNVQRKGGYQKRHYLHWSADVEYESEDSPQGIPL